MTSEKILPARFTAKVTEMFLLRFALANMTHLAFDAATIHKFRFSLPHGHGLQLASVRISDHLGKQVPLDNTAITTMMAIGESGAMMKKAIVTVVAIMLVNAALLAYFLYRRKKDLEHEDRSLNISAARLWDGAVY